jgi:hypothetical protein
MVAVAGKIRNKYKELKSVLCSKHLAMWVKSKVYEVHIMNCEFLGSESRIQLRKLDMNEVHSKSCRMLFSNTRFISMVLMNKPATDKISEVIR